MDQKKKTVSRTVKKSQGKTQPKKKRKNRESNFHKPIPSGDLNSDKRTLFLILILFTLIITAVILFSQGTFSRILNPNNNQEDHTIIVERRPLEKNDRETAPQETITPPVQKPDTVTETIAEKPVIEKPEAPADSTTRKSRIFFVKVNDQGLISMKSVLKPVNYKSSPLTKTLNTLLNGPEQMELNAGLLSLIPKGSVLLSAKIENGTAYLNFNEDFRFNTLGIEGYHAQLRQIIFTATEFPNIRNVIFLIEGEKIDYLGAEGVYIGEPLNRDSFS